MAGAPHAGSAAGTGGTGGAAGSGTSYREAVRAARGGPSETQCANQKDDDCDGFVDCLDSDCEAKSCGSGGALVCTAGACLQPSDGLPELPRIDNVRVTQRGDTVDHRLRAGRERARLPRVSAARPERRAGRRGRRARRAQRDLPLRRRPPVPRRARTIPRRSSTRRSAAPRTPIHDYERNEADSVLGYVYLTPAPDRKPVYRMADPQGGGGFMNADWVVPMFARGQPRGLRASAKPSAIACARRATATTASRSTSPTRGTSPIYRRVYEEDWNGVVSVFYGEGDEYDARSDDRPADVARVRRALQGAATRGSEGSVALHRVLYNGGNTFDVLAAGEPRYQRVLHQGNQPLWTLSWPGLDGEDHARDRSARPGLPLPRRLHRRARRRPPTTSTTRRSRSTRRASTTGEVFINGQHDGDQPAQADRARLRRRHARARSRHGLVRGLRPGRRRGTSSRSRAATTASSSTATPTGRSTSRAAPRTSPSGRCSASSSSATPTGARAAT